VVSISLVGLEPVRYLIAHAASNEHERALRRTHFRIQVHASTTKPPLAKRTLSPSTASTSII
jgi:hypothetical protein